MADNLSPQAGPSQQPVRNKLPVWFWMLIGCGGLGLLFFIVAVIAAIAIRNRLNTPTRSLSNEASAAVALIDCSESQLKYRKTNGQYADPYTKLYNATAPAKSLIPADLAGASGRAGIPKDGYLFQNCRTIGGKPIDWNKDFAACATPAVYGQTGRSTFIISTDGKFWTNDLGKSQFVDDFPANPRAAGWLGAD